MSYGFVFAFIFAFVSRWPKLLVWGSYAFVASFPVFLIVLSFVFFSLTPHNQTRRSQVTGTFFLGLLIGYIGAIHAVFYEVIIAALFLFVFGKLLHKKET